MEIVKTDHSCPEEVFICECHSLGHIFSIIYFEEYKEDPPEMYLTLQLEQYIPWWKRILIGGKFAFVNKQYDDTIFNSVMIRQFDMDRLVNILQLMGHVSGDSDAPVLIESEQYLLTFEREIEKWDNCAMSEFTLSIEFPHDLCFFRRLWRAVKFAWGWKSRYGNCDSMDIDEQQAKSLMHLAELHRDLSEAELAEKDIAST